MLEKMKMKKKKVSKRKDNTFCDYEKEEVESTEKLNKRRNKNLHCFFIKKKKNYFIPKSIKFSFNIFSLKKRVFSHLLQFILT